MKHEKSGAPPDLLLLCRHFFFPLPGSYAGRPTYCTSSATSRYGLYTGSCQLIHSESEEGGKRRSSTITNQYITAIVAGDSDSEARRRRGNTCTSLNIISLAFPRNLYLVLLPFLKDQTIRMTQMFEGFQICVLESFPTMIYVTDSSAEDSDSPLMY